MDVAAIIVNLLQNITSLGQKLYDLVTYRVDLTWLTKVLGFFHSDLALPTDISIMGLFVSIGAIPLAIIVVYSIFKP